VRPLAVTEKQRSWGPTPGCRRSETPFNGYSVSIPPPAPKLLPPTRFLPVAALALRGSLTRQWWRGSGVRWKEGEGRPSPPAGAALPPQVRAGPAAPAVLRAQVKFSPFSENRLAVATLRTLALWGMGGNMCSRFVPGCLHSSNALPLLQLQHSASLQLQGGVLDLVAAPERRVKYERHSSLACALCLWCRRGWFPAEQVTPGGMVELMAFDTADGLYDCCWSEVGRGGTPPAAREEGVVLVVDFLG